MNREFIARRASSDEADHVATIIALAFVNDPLWSHALNRIDGRTEHHAVFWRLFVEGALRYPWTWLTSGGEATSTWIPPGGTELSPEQEERLRVMAYEHLGPRAEDFLELLARFDAAHPHGEPHYYLSLLGTHPDHVGKGWGMRLLADNLASIDAEHLPAYLESSNPANNHRYASVGFEPFGEFTFPGNGPLVTTMWRAAR